MVKNRKNHNLSKFSFVKEKLSSFVPSLQAPGEK
jgi:hypothetical protein